MAIALKGLIHTNLRVSLIPLEPKDLDALKEMARRHEGAHITADINSASSDISHFKQAYTYIIQQLAALVSAVHLQKAASSVAPQEILPRHYIIPSPRRRPYQQQDFPQRDTGFNKYPQPSTQQHSSDTSKCQGCI